MRIKNQKKILLGRWDGVAWQTPKTNWVSTDYFNTEDYNRIIGNIAELRKIAIQAYPTFSIASMGGEKTYSDYIYADEINTIESNLTTICNNTYPFAIGDQKTYYPNQPATNYAEFNRIESACLTIYQNLQGQLSGKRRLSFILGGDTLLL